MNKRRWVQHRQAYFPRPWSSYPVAAALLIGLLSVLQLRGILATLIAPLIAVTVGVGVVYGRVWIWKRRHPIISPEEWYRHMRENATWN